MQLKHETSISTLGSVKGKKCGRSLHLPLVAEDRAGEGEQRALEVGERDVLVDREPLDLVELRRVRRVVVAAVDAAGDDDVDRRRLQLHRARLHRARVRPQDDVVPDVEGVGAVARGVRDRVVERVEVVVDEVDLGALGDREAEAEEDVLDLAAGRGEEVVAADGLGRRAGQRDVDAVGDELRVELAGLERGRPLVDERLERLARLVGAAAHRPRAAPAAGSATPRRRFGSSALRPRHLHPHLLERRGRVGGGDRRLGLGAEL